MIGGLSTPVVTIELLAACVWVGSMVCLAVVTSTARRVLDTSNQVALFRAVGRRYSIVGSGSLLISIGAGLWLGWPPSNWSNLTDAAVALAGLLVVATLAGMAQARAMTVLRQRSINTPSDERTARLLVNGRRLAGTLRAFMAVDTLAIVVLAAEIASR